MRKLFFLFVTLVATTSLWAFQSGDLYYRITSSSAPYTVEVTYEKYYSDYNYSSLTTATIPETVNYNGTTYSVTSIGDLAFYHCSSLTSITIPNSVTSIGRSAFYRCSSLTSPVYNAHCFAYMPPSYSGAYTILEGIKQIGDRAFCDCSSLTSITIPNSVTSIGSSAFACCTSLSSITIPENVSFIGESAFAGCSSVSTVYYNAIACGDIEQNSTSKKNSPFLFVGNRLDKNVYEYETNSGGFDVVIGENVQRIPANIFSNEYFRCFDIGSSQVIGGSGSIRCLVKVNSVTFAENSVCEEIGDGAFYGDSITTISLPQCLKTIGRNALAYCEHIESITIPKLVDYCGYGAFYGCDKMISVYWESIHCNNLYSQPFIYSLKQLTIGENVEYIPDYLFSYLTNIDTIIIPNKVKEIGNHVFEGCEARVIQLSNQLENIGDYTFYNCLNISHVNIPHTVESIGVSAFENCINIDTIAIPDNVKNIGERCFAYTSVSKVNIGNGLTIIPESSFYSCSNLETLILGKNIKTIKDNAFWGCETLSCIYNYRERPGVMYSTSFDGVDKFYCKLYVPSESLEMYKAASGWREFYDIIAMREIPTREDNIVNINSSKNKLLRNGQVYILQDGKTYTIMGQEL